MTLKAFDDQELAAALFIKLEWWWKDWKQSLLLLAFLLHPFYHDSKFNLTILNLSFSHLAKCILYLGFRKKSDSISDSQIDSRSNRVES